MHELKRLKLFGSTLMYIYFKGSVYIVVALLLCLFFAIYYGSVAKLRFIAFEVFINKNWEIYIADFEKRIVVNVSRNPLADDLQPTWSYDNQLAYTSYISPTYENSEIYILQLNQPESINIINGLNSSNDYPSWSPDGKLAFVSKQNGLFSDIYIMETLYKDPINVIHTPFDDKNPSWLSENEIVFLSMGQHTNQVYVANLSTNFMVNISNNLMVNIFPQASLYNNQVAFFAYPTLNASGEKNLYIWDKKTSKTTLIAKVSPFSSALPKWSTNGALAFVSEVNGKNEVYIYNSLNNQIFQVIEDTSNNINPSWSPDNNMIAFISDRSGQQGVYIFDLTIQSTREIYTANPSANPVWSK